MTELVDARGVAIAPGDTAIPHRGVELEERFWSKVDWSLTEDRCWPWLAYVTKSGYGTFSIKNSPCYAHCVAYELEVGPIPGGAQLDHRCRNRACVNPDHLEVVDGRTNTLRGVGPTAINARKVECPSGHAYDKVDNKGSRRCSTCRREQALDYYYRKAAR